MRGVSGSTSLAATALTLAQPALRFGPRRTLTATARRRPSDQPRQGVVDGSSRFGLGVPRTTSATAHQPPRPAGASGCNRWRLRPIHTCADVELKVHSVVEQPADREDLAFATAHEEVAWATNVAPTRTATALCKLSLIH